MKIKTRELLLLLTAISSLIAYIIFYYDNETASKYGTVLSAYFGAIAFIGFFLSLQAQHQQLILQSKQLEEQKNQFLEESVVRREDSRRQALLMANDILKEAERNALKTNPEVKAIEDIYINYFHFSYMKPMTESSNPETVHRYSKVFLPKEKAALFLIKGIKCASEIYFRAINKTDIDFSKPPEDFVYIYSPWIKELPYFDQYIGIATLLSQIMTLLQPGRKSCMLASNVASGFNVANCQKIDKIREQAKEIEDNKGIVPAIVKRFLQENRTMEQ